MISNSSSFASGNQGPNVSGTGAFSRSPNMAERRWAAARSLGQAVTVASLYKISHPVTQRAVEDARAALEFGLETGRALTLGLGATGWLVDGAPLSQGTPVPEALAALFKGRGWNQLVFWPGVQSSELSALCELSALPADGSSGGARAFLDNRGVRHVTLGSDRPGQTPPASAPRPVARVPAPRATAAPPPPPALPPSPAPAAPADKRPFNAFLQTLVERSGAGPNEQAQLYREALILLREGMKEALESQVSAAQAQLEGHARHLVAECQRTQRVLASVAEGRVTVDTDGRVLMMNEVAEQIAGKRFQDLAGRPLSESVAGGAQVLALTLAGTLPGSSTPRLVIRGETAAYEAFRKSVALVYDPDGRVVGTYGILPHAAKAQETARLQEDFVSRVTHELKAPLTAISAALELLEQNCSPELEELQRELLATSQRNAGRLRRLIDDILDFESLQNGSLQLRPVPCDAAAIVTEAVAALAPWADTKLIRLSASVASPGPEPILADDERIVQVLTNLLSNALKSTPAGGQVDAGVTADGPFARFWVRDTGCGIAPADQQRIFEKFVQLQNDSREGVGLGLAIVADLVERHGGTLTVNSEPGKGSIFYFTIPLAPRPS